MAEKRGEISRRHALRLVLGQGGEVARERDRLHLELDQAAAMEGARPGKALPAAQDPAARGSSPAG